MPMNKCSLHTIVNFRASKQLLETFDRVCLLSGKTRTQVLSEMMKQRISTVGSKLPSRISRQQELDDRIKNASESRPNAERYERPKEWSIAVKRRLKPFSSFVQSEL
ncbi:MAG: hypothetical protein JST16_03900 [Bdellovibrionales bacterium]|nr:hypothetical protein [Bdellovibrionales bacterium]